MFQVKMILKDQGDLIFRLDEIKLCYIFIYRLKKRKIKNCFVSIFVLSFRFLSCRNDIISRSKMNDEARRKATEDEPERVNQNDNSNESERDDDVFYDSDGNIEQEER